MDKDEAMEEYYRSIVGGDDGEPPEGPPPGNVILACNREILDVADVDVLELDRDPDDDMIVTFRCHECGNIHVSYIYG